MGSSSAGGSLITLPTYGSASVPHGMWHQFGTLPESPDKGIFLDIAPIPENWLRYHHEVINTGSIYNDYDVTSARLSVYRRMQSLAGLGGFTKTGQTTRLGELKDKATIREAIVAVPYIIEAGTQPGDTTLPSDSPTRITRKKFIDIPKQRFDAAKATPGSREADSLGTAGASIRKLMQKIPRYVFPPQFDFVNNPDIGPIVMYIFEFEYKFDRDDLSYMWQNLAPRNSRKMTFQHSSVAHELMDTELLTEKALLDNQELRWMVFKVKQRSKKGYYELVADQAGQASTEIFGSKITEDRYKIQYNWPYDYLSFVELIKMDVDVLFRAEDVGASPETDVSSAGDPKEQQDALAAAKEAAVAAAATTRSRAATKKGSGSVKTKTDETAGNPGASSTTTETGGSKGGGGTGGSGQQGGGGGGNY